MINGDDFEPIMLNEDAIDPAFAEEMNAIAAQASDEPMMTFAEAMAWITTL